MSWRDLRWLPSLSVGHQPSTEFMKICSSIWRALQWWKLHLVVGTHCSWRVWKHSEADLRGFLQNPLQTDDAIVSLLQDEVAKRCWTSDGCRAREDELSSIRSWSAAFPHFHSVMSSVIHTDWQVFVRLDVAPSHVRVCTCNCQQYRYTWLSIASLKLTGLSALQ